MSSTHNRSEKYEGRDIVLQKVDKIDLPDSLEPYSDVDLSDEKEWYAVVVTFPGNSDPYDLTAGRGHTQTEAVDRAFELAREMVNDENSN